MNRTVTCLIPAWNEAARIGPVLRATLGHPLVAEVIVIDDGSTDDTAAVARDAGALVLRQRRNSGKSAAIARGLAAARGDLILLLDADLAGLTAAHLSDLLGPVLTGRADAAISLRANAPRAWRVIGLDYISGERVMPRDMLAGHLPRIAGLRRFGLEVFVNELWIAQRLRLAVVPLPVASPAKAAKHGVWRGLRADAAMLGDIARTVGIGRALAQIVSLRQQRQAWSPPYRGPG
jgi:glycosyltransferase involved in cell wall biosynthesis